MGYEKIFFTYSRVDGEQPAAKLASELRQLNAHISIYQSNTKGNTGTADIEGAIRESDCILFIATPASAASRSVLSEVYFGIEENKNVISLVFGDCDIPFRLANLPQIDFTTNFSDAFQRLVAILDLEASPQSLDSLQSAEERPPAEKSYKAPDEHNHGRQLKEELLWGRAVSSNTLDLYDEYLFAFPKGKFSDLANKRKAELIELEQRQLEFTRDDSGRNRWDQRLPGNKGSNRKAIMIAGVSVLALAIIVVAIYLVISTNRSTSNSSTADVVSTDTAVLHNPDSTQQPSLTEPGNTLLSDQLSKGSNAPTESDASKLRVESDSKVLNPSSNDFDAFIYEKVPGTWYETISRNDGLTSSSAQTYYANGNLEGVFTFKNANEVVVASLTFSGIWSVKDGHLYEEVNSSSDQSILAVGYSQRTRVTSITNDILDYIDTEGIARRMFRVKL